LVGVATLRELFATISRMGDALFGPVGPIPLSKSLVSKWEHPTVSPDVQIRRRARLDGIASDSGWENTREVRDLEIRVVEPGVEWSGVEDSNFSFRPFESL
jgi:hypothetical protein